MAFRLCHKFRSHSEPASLSGTFLQTHTPSIAFRHLPPNSARFSYATEGSLFISAQLSTDAVSGPPKGSGTNTNDCRTHTPSTAFRHIPPNSARFSYATEGALFISAQLSTDAVSALRKVRVLISVTVEPTLREPGFGLAVRR